MTADNTSADRGLADDALDLFVRSQEQALALATDTLRKVRAVAVGGAAVPEELLKQVAELSGAVTSLAGTATGVVGGLAQPVQDLIVQQRELSETIARFAAAQAELAVVVAEFARRQAATVAALERLTGPVFGVVGVKERE